MIVVHKAIDPGELIRKIFGNKDFHAGGTGGFDDFAEPKCDDATFIKIVK